MKTLEAMVLLMLGICMGGLISSIIWISEERSGPMINRAAKTDRVIVLPEQLRP